MRLLLLCFLTFTTLLHYPKVPTSTCHSGTANFAQKTKTLLELLDPEGCVLWFLSCLQPVTFWEAQIFPPQVCLNIIGHMTKNCQIILYWQVLNLKTFEFHKLPFSTRCITFPHSLPFLVLSAYFLKHKNERAKKRKSEVLSN